MQVLLVTLPASIEVISQPASKQAPASSYVSRFLKVKPQVFSESRAVLSGFEANPERCCRLEVPLVRLFLGGLQVPGGLFVFVVLGVWARGDSQGPEAPSPLPLPAALSHGFLRVRAQVFTEAREVLLGFKANPERGCSPEVPLVGLFLGGLQVPVGSSCSVALGVWARGDSQGPEAPFPFPPPEAVCGSRAVLMGSSAGLERRCLSEVLSVRWGQWISCLGLWYLDVLESSQLIEFSAYEGSNFRRGVDPHVGSRVWLKGRLRC